MTADALASFLAGLGWDGAARAPVAGGFSTRRLHRLTRSGAEPATAITMEDPDPAALQAFLRVGQKLREAGFSAPEIYGTDPAQGLALVEDFGEANLGAFLDEGIAPAPLFRLSAELLAALHDRLPASACAPLDLPVFDSRRFLDQVMPGCEDWIPWHRKGAKPDPGETQAFRALWEKLLAPVESWPRALLLRDFMMDNLMLLPDRKGLQRLGLLDFQDAGTGPEAYDLASLAEGVRRDAGPRMREEILAAYARARPGDDPDARRAQMRLLAVQRHTRLLGLFARTGGLPPPRDKTAYLPTLVATLRALLREDPVFRPLEAWFHDCAPLRAF